MNRSNLGFSNNMGRKMERNNVVIYACDIGSIIQDSFAWVRVIPGRDPSASNDINILVESLLQDIDNGMNIALGFESPLFMPIPTNSQGLNHGRQGEGCFSMFAQAGLAVTTIGIQQISWILNKLKGKNLLYTLKHNEWLIAQKPTLLLWEAFVAGNPHAAPGNHQGDAATAAVYFLDNMNNLNEINAVYAENPLSLVHATALWAGLANDTERLHSNCLVLKPQHQYHGPIVTAQ